MSQEERVEIYNPITLKWGSVLGNPSDFPYTSRFLVTPEWALEVLENRNLTNRRLEKRRISKYAQDMINNNWQMSNDDICFDKEGFLQNGQHRLQAVVDAQKPIMMSFKFGMDHQALTSMDEGRSRSNLDIMRITGKNTTRQALSCTNYALEVHRKKEIMSRKQILDFHERHKDAAMFATGTLDKKPFCKAPVHAALMRAWYHYNTDRDRLQQFAQIVADGKYNNSRTDSAALKLRDYLIANPLSNGTERFNLYYKTENAINLFMNYEEITLLRKITEEIFPLPEEKIESRYAQV